MGRLIFRVLTLVALIGATAAANAPNDEGGPVRAGGALFPRMVPVDRERLLTVVVVTADDGQRHGLDRDVAEAVVATAGRIWDDETAGRICVRLAAIVEASGEMGDEMVESAVEPDRRCGIDRVAPIAERIGWKPGPGRHLVVMEPVDGCGNAQAQISGPWVWLAWRHGQGIVEAGVDLAHELGHNFGLNHTWTGACAPVFEPACPLTAERDGGRSDYGGDDFLGAGTRTLNPIARYQLGLLDELTVIDASEPGTRTVDLFEDNQPGRTRVVVIDDRRRRSSFWLSVASAGAALGANSTDRREVRVHTWQRSPLGVQILQQRTGDGERYLRPGERYPAGDATVTVVVTDTRASVTVTVP